MFVQPGDEVILVDSDQPHLRLYIGTMWRVESTMMAYHPASAIIVRGEIKASMFLRNLAVVPPADSPFKYNDLVKIRSTYEKTASYSCNKNLIGKAGHIKNYDSRNGFYYIKCTTNESGWFPLHSLLPLDFKGDRFYYPYDTVKYKGKEKIINKIKSSRFKWGQLLLIDGEWIHASDVEPIK